jgi:hypothetical protein
MEQGFRDHQVLGEASGPGDTEQSHVRAKIGPAYVTMVAAAATHERLHRHMGSRRDGGIVAGGIDYSGDLVARLYARRIAEGRMHDVEIGPADSTRGYADSHPAGPRLRQVAFPDANGPPAAEYGCFHVHLPDIEAS